VLQELHWLPVRRRVDFKMATLVYLSLSGIAPAYLATGCHLVSDEGRRQLRSATSRTCVVRRTYSNYGDRCFAAAGLKLWNSLPTQLRQADISFQRFKRLLKTVVFRCWDRGALWLTVKAAPHKFSYLLTYWPICWRYCCQVAERVLSFWGNEYISALISDNVTIILPILYPALFEMSRSHWNQQIIQLTQTVLRYLHDVNRTLFDDVAAKHRQNVVKYVTSPLTPSVAIWIQL